MHIPEVVQADRLDASALRYVVSYIGLGKGFEIGPIVAATIYSHPLDTKVVCEQSNPRSTPRPSVGKTSFESRRWLDGIVAVPLSARITTSAFSLLDP
jgi:hypothetical protein